eukprot:1195981-Prorocentrum_minimum.AAC.1
MYCEYCEYKCNANFVNICEYFANTCEYYTNIGGWQIPLGSPTPAAGYLYKYTFRGIRIHAAKLRTRAFPRHVLLTRIGEASVPQSSDTIARDNEVWTTRYPTMLLSSSTFVTTRIR